jgi:hypothetical protein
MTIITKEKSVVNIREVIFRLGPQWSEGLPRRGYTTQPRVSTLGTLKNKGFALKGREMRGPDEARTYCRPKVRVRNWDVLRLDIGLRFHLVKTFNLAPLQGAALMVDDSQG